MTGCVHMVGMQGKNVYNSEWLKNHAVQEVKHCLYFFQCFSFCVNILGICYVRLDGSRYDIFSVLKYFGNLFCSLGWFKIEYLLCS
jgi:hypothetical protein